MIEVNVLLLVLSVLIPTMFMCEMRLRAASRDTPLWWRIQSSMLFVTYNLFNIYMFVDLESE